MKPNKYFLFLLSFIEGGAVMACELLGAKMITPFFGSSLYVWASVLGVTLGALMSGYYVGGFVSEKVKKENLLYWILMFAGVLLAFMPYISAWIMGSTIDFSVKSGSAVSLLVFLFPPLMLMGMSSPLIINLLNEKVDLTGKTAGSVYAVSTLGGIISTFLLGFYLMPEFGLKLPAFGFGALLILLPALYLIKRKKYAAILPLFILGLSLLLLSGSGKKRSARFKVLYSSEGILGQIKVVDLDFNTAIRGTRQGRILFVNNTGQTISDRNDPKYSLWDWAYFYATAASIYPKGSDVLLLGLGGGTFLNQFERLQFNTDAVELDERIKDVAIRYFGVDPQTNIIVDDARHYINTSQKKYHIITLDLFLNETPPAHMLTLEAFTRIKQLLNPKGMVMINFYGYLSGEKGKPSRSLCKTLLAAGYKVSLLPTPGDESKRNLIILAGTEELDFTHTTYTEPGLPALGNLHRHFIDPNSLDLQDAIVLSDALPALEKMYIRAALDWRKDVNNYFTKQFLADNVSMIR